MNLLDDDGWLERTWPREKPGLRWRRKRVAGSEEPARVLLVSNFALPRAGVQLDSRKLMIRWSREPDDARWFRLDGAAEYWEGEAD